MPTPKEIVAGVMAILGIVPGLFKKKPYKLLIWNVVLKKWERTHDGAMSARQCKKLRKALEGQSPWRYIVVRESVHEADIPAPTETGQ